MAGTIIFGIDVESASEDSTGFAQYGAELFRELNIPVTWYLTGKTLERYADIFRKIEGSELIELQAHTYDHILLKTVLMKIPAEKRIHGSTDWYIQRGGSLEDIDRDLRRCQLVFENVLGRRATGLTGPWGYYRGLGDRIDLLEMVHRHGFKILRTFARNEYDAQPVPIEWQPFFYKLQGFPEILECLVHGYQDDYYWEDFARPDTGGTYLDYLKSLADKVAEQDLTWSFCSHDHRCATREGFNNKGRWYRGIIEYAKNLGVRFLSVSQFYEEMLSRKKRKEEVT